MGAIRREHVVAHSEQVECDVDSLAQPLCGGQGEHLVRDSRHAEVVGSDGRRARVRVGEGIRAAEASTRSRRELRAQLESPGDPPSRRPIPPESSKDVSRGEIGKVEDDGFLQVGVEERSAQAHLRAVQPLVDPTIYCHRPFRAKAWVSPVVEAARIGGERPAEALVHRRGAESIPGVGAQLCLGSLNEVCRRDIAGVGVAGISDGGCLVRTGRACEERRSRIEELQSARNGDMQPAVQHPDLVLTEYCMADLVDLNPAHGRVRALVGVEIGESLGLKLVPQTQQVVAADPLVGPSLQQVRLAVEAAVVAKHRIVQPGPGRAVLVRALGPDVLVSDPVRAVRAHFVAKRNRRSDE